MMLRSRELNCQHHIVDIDYDGLYLTERAQHLSDMADWCMENIGHIALDVLPQPLSDDRIWDCHHFVLYARFYFLKLEHATEFKLVWC